MSEENQKTEIQVKRENAISLLNKNESKAYEEFKESGNPGLAPSLANAFFELYLNGSSTYEIHKLNKAFHYGAIVDAKVRYLWDEKKDQYISTLHDGTIARLTQIQAESTGFLADALSVAHKKYGTAFKRYLQTGDEREIAGFDIGSIAAYQKTIESLMKITGADQKKKVELSGTTTKKLEIGGLSSEKPLSPEQAAKIIEFLGEDSDD